MLLMNNLLEEGKKLLQLLMINQSVAKRIWALTINLSGEATKEVLMLKLEVMEKIFPLKEELIT